MVTLERVETVWTQEPDSNQSPSDLVQTLTITSEDAGDGQYLVISTTRWAVDSPADLVALLEAVQTMAGMRPVRLEATA